MGGTVWETGYKQENYATENHAQVTPSILDGGRCMCVSVFVCGCALHILRICTCSIGRQAEAAAAADVNHFFIKCEIVLRTRPELCRLAPSFGSVMTR